jgi:hypothetical protein
LGSHHFDRSGRWIVGDGDTIPAWYGSSSSSSWSFCWRVDTDGDDAAGRRRDGATKRSTVDATRHQPAAHPSRTFLCQRVGTPHDANTVAALVGVHHVGYIPAELARDYSPRCFDWPQRGVLASGVARIWAKDDSGIVRARVSAGRCTLTLKSVAGGTLSQDRPRPPAAATPSQ